MPPITNAVKNAVNMHFHPITAPHAAQSFISPPPKAPGIIQSNTNMGTYTHSISAITSLHVKFPDTKKSTIPMPGIINTRRLGISIVLISITAMITSMPASTNFTISTSPKILPYFHLPLVRFFSNLQFLKVQYKNRPAG